MSLVGIGQEEVIRRRAVVSEEMHAPEAKALWHGLGLAAVLALSAFLNLFRLTNVGYANTYYAAAVKDMLTSWSNFFFVSFDSGFVSVDKPPLGLWVQAASAYLFGFHGWALLLPQALAGVLCVALLYHLVRKPFGPVAGLVAALALALTPIVVATSRNNTMDMLLVLCVLVAAWVFVVAAERGSLGWLLLGAVLVGIGFNIKMLQAFLVLPAFYVFYLLAARTSWWKRLVHLFLATVVLLVVSLSWAVAVDLTPPTERPYVGSSSDDTETGLILGYNGLDRLSGISFAGEKARPAGKIGGPGLGAAQNGAPGPLRLLNQYYAGQIGWLLPLATVGLLTAGFQRGFRPPLDHRQGALVLWGTWFLTMAAYFSIAGGQHRYYTVMLAPAVAVLVGIGVVALWREYRGPGQEGWLLPLALLGTAALHARILGSYESWSLGLAAVVVGSCFIAAVVLVFLRSNPKPKAGVCAAVATITAVLALLIAPTVWASYQVFEGPRGPMPLAGPPPPKISAGTSGGFGTQGDPAESKLSSTLQVPSGASDSGEASPSGSLADPALIHFLLANQGDSKYLVAGTRSRNTAPIILSTDEPVISLGGYSGVDPVFTERQLTDLVSKGAVRFLLIPNTQRMNCNPVPRELWQSSPSGRVGSISQGDQTLYDCGVRGG